MTKIVVTGGAGFIGSHLVDKLIETGYSVVVLDNLSTGKKGNLNSRAEFQEFDICQFEKIKPLFQRVDFVFHLAAIPRVPLSIKNPVKTSRVNIQGTVNVFRAAQQGGVQRIIFASSASVYGEQKEPSLRESMTPNPISPYGLQKLVGEQFAKLFTKLYNIPTISLRYFNIYGPRIDFDSDYSLVIGKFLRQRAQGKPLTIFGDGEQTRSFCFVDDVIKANMVAMESEKLRGGEVINIGNKKSYSVNYLAQLLGGEKQYLPPKPGDPRHSMADISRAQRFLAWQPDVSFEEGIRRTQEWFEKTISHK